jgi:hypothetical protein
VDARAGAPNEDDRVPGTRRRQGEISMHAARPVLLVLLALAGSGTALAGTAGARGEPALQCTGPSLPFYAYAPDGGDRIAIYRGPDHPEYYATFGLVYLQLDGAVLMENAGTLRLSRDSACTWEELHTVAPGDSPLHLVAAPGGGAYGFTLNGQGFYEIATDGTDFTVTKRRTPAPALMGVGVDPGDARHVYIGGSDGQIHHSFDGGETWTRLGTPPAQTSLAYRFAFDPHDPSHAIFGVVSEGGWVTFDAGASWTPIAGLSATGGPVNLFNAVFSPVDGNVAWAMALDIDQADNGHPSGGRHFYLSLDGGRTFVPVVDDSAEITITNGPEITPHPRLPLRFAWVFGSTFSGLEIYQYDAVYDAIKHRHFPGLLARSVAYAPKNPRNLLIGLEGGL